MSIGFYAPTNVTFGTGAEDKVAEVLKGYGAEKVLVHFGGGSVKRSGLLDKVEKSLTSAGIGFIELGGVVPNPRVSLVRKGIELVNNEGIDFILAVGGGSVLDSAKAIGYGAYGGGDVWDFYCGKAKIQKALPVGVILTIAAAGSEGSGNSVITNLSNMQKLSLRCPEHLRPRFSILNPELTMTLPPYQTASGICDMMVHIFERYFNNTAETGITDRVSEGVLMSIMDEAPKVMANPQDYGARANIMWAGMLAHNGICGTGVVEDWASHFMEHELSALYGVTHGAGLAVMFPAWLTVVSRINPHRAKQLALRVLHVSPEGKTDEEIIAEGIARLREFWHSLGLPITLKELGIENPDIDTLVRNLHIAKGEPIGNYVKLDRKLTKEIYEEAR